MRLRAAAGLPLLSSLFLFGTSALGCLDLTQNTGDDAGASTSTGDGGAAGEAGIVGGGCGIEQQSGIELCVATSMCPNVVVDTQAMPSCGFRVRGGAVDLVCACGTAICPVGIFTTCAQASQLLANQTEQGVCIQIAEGRCVESGAPPPSSSSGGNPACDRQCLQQCGGGEACASVCNCD